jgi:hypothetical protein
LVSIKQAIIGNHDERYADTQGSEDGARSLVP